MRILLFMDSMAREYHQGRFTPKNPQKYLGDATNVIFRSSWELKLMIGLDLHTSVLAWGSEEIVIPYYWEGDGKPHRYFPDFIAVMKTPNGNVKYLIEVKPHAQTLEPKRGNKREKTFINEVTTYSKNKAKWLAAESYCADRGWVFKIVTEKDLYKTKPW